MATNAYAPYNPQVLGDSWVPIKEEPMPLSVSQEQGYWFNLSGSSTVVTARVYPGVDTLSAVGYSTPYVNVYPESSFDDFGPIQQVVVPANSVTLGSNVTATVGNASSVVQAISDPNSVAFVIFRNTVSGQPTVSFGFNTSAASTQLTGKRILNVEMLYQAQWEGASINSSEDPYYLENYISSSSGSTWDTLFLAESLPFTSGTGTSNFTSIPARQFSPVTPFYNTEITPATGDRYPYVYAGLSRFDSTITTAAQRLTTSLTLFNDNPVANDGFYLFYLALRITYCNETRVGFGARYSAGVTPQVHWGPEGSVYSVPILDPTITSAPTFAAGNYVVTVTEGNYNLARRNMPIKALRQLYAQDEPGIQGVVLPYNNFNDFTLESEPTDQIPAITLHTSSAVVNDTHGYTDQMIAPVYTGVVAQQGVLNTSSGTQSYNLARFYARRLGDTTSPLGLRLQSTPTTYAEISVDDFDALDEITDGWKQVDLEFTSAIPSFSAAGTATTMEFFSNTSSGTRWEVLGARSQIVSGFANNVEIGPNHWGAPTTYGGTTAVATWDQGSGTPTIDFRGDITLMMATMPTVTGLSIEQNLLEVDVTDECDQAPGGIPTGVYYNTLSWSGASADVVGDTFDRTVVASGWGTSTSGSVWSVTEGASSVWLTTGTQGFIDPAATSTSYMNMTNTSLLNATLEATVTPTAVVGTQSSVYLVMRYSDTSNWYAARFTFETDGRSSVGLEKNVAGTPTTLVAATYGGTTYVAGSSIKIKAMIKDSVLMAKSWNADSPEPPDWTAVAIDTSLTTAGTVGMRANVGDASVSYSVDDFTAQWGFGAFELQRSDQWTDWQTIMLATSPLIASFNDFEARVGVESEYRMRVCQELDFCGPWTSTVMNSITAPGVTGTDVSSSLLIFTSNARPDGTDTLAYSEIFDGTPAQTFAFLEASGVTMQPMYLRDYQVAYHGVERGGEAFSRTILFNNAAVSIANFEQAFQSLRDLAWDSVPYVCVRDQHGSRWFANVIVGGGTIQPPSNSLWFAEVTVTEVTGTAYPVDPS